MSTGYMILDHHLQPRTNSCHPSLQKQLLQQPQLHISVIDTAPIPSNNLSISATSSSSSACPVLETTTTTSNTITATCQDAKETSKPRRYMSIIHPLSVKKRTLQSAGAAMAIAWSIAILFSALPILNLDYYGDEFYGNNGVCLPLHIHDPFGQAWEYSTFLFCGLNFAAFLYILFAYISMFFTISHSKIGLRCTQQQQDRNIAKRFFFIVATDFLCWVPIVFIKVIAMTGVPIQEDLYAWVAVFLLPVNSAINPILYTLTTKLFKQHLAKMVYNFKASTGDSVTPSCARNHSLRSQKGSFSQCRKSRKSLESPTTWHDFSQFRQRSHVLSSGVTAYPELRKCDVNQDQIKSRARDLPQFAILEVLDHADEILDAQISRQLQCIILRLYSRSLYSRYPLKKLSLTYQHRHLRIQCFWSRLTFTVE
ncbi:relaxin receptor 1 [Trichonephila clavipes]|nr:relaxin receptor 1 [Trichonephila clavipes]